MFDSRITRTVAMLLVTTAVAAVAAGSALAETRPAASYYTPAQIQTMSQSWAARVTASQLTPEQRKAQTQAWEAEARLIRPSSPSDSFGWSDFGIGAAAVLGLLLLAGGLITGARYSRRAAVAAHARS